MPQTLTQSQVFTPEQVDAWRKQLFALAVVFGLPTTSWRVGDPERVILEILSYVGQNWDATASLIAQGGFLDWAATGTVTYQNADGTSTTVAVSPDPSTNANPDGKSTWLDQLCEQNYLTERIRKSPAGGPMALINTSASTYGPFTAGGYHVANPNNGAAYSSTVDIASLPPSSVVGTAITGAADNGGGLVELTFSTAHGLVDGDPLFVLGVLGTVEANGAWYVTSTGANTLTLDGSTFTNAYTSGGTGYAPQVVSFTADVAGTMSNSVDADGVTAARTITTSVTSLIGVQVQNLEPFEGSDTESNPALLKRAKLKLQSVTTNGAQGAYEYYALSSILYAPKLATPLSVASAITRAKVIGDKLTGHTNVFVASANGAPTDDDLAATDAVIQAYATPVSHTTSTLKATNVGVTAVFEVYAKSSYCTAANKALLIAAVQAYVRVLDIGGETDPGGDYTNVLPLNDIIGVIFETGVAIRMPVENVTATLNGVAANVSLPVSATLASVARLSATPTINWHPT